MNFASLPISILFFAVVYLVVVYGLLTIAQMLKRENIIASNSNKTNSRIKTP